MIKYTMLAIIVLLTSACASTGQPLDSRCKYTRHSTYTFPVASSTVYSVTCH